MATKQICTNSAEACDIINEFTTDILDETLNRVLHNNDFNAHEWFNDRYPDGWIEFQKILLSDLPEYLPVTWESEEDDDGVPLKDWDESDFVFALGEMAHYDNAEGWLREKLGLA